MEYKDVFISVAIVAIAVIGILGYVSSMNEAYGDTAGSSFNETMLHVNVIGNITSIGNTVGGNTQTEDGAGDSDTQQNIIKQSLRTLKVVPQLLGIVPALISDAQKIAGAPDWIVNILRAIFIFVFALTFAYILILGAKRP